MSRIDELVSELAPNGVEYVRLSDVSEYANARLDLSALTLSTYVGVESLLQNARGRIDASSLPPNGNAIRFAVGDILLGNIRPYLKKVWLADRDGGTNGDVLVIRVSGKYRESLLPRFLYFLLSSDEFFAYDMQFSKGAKMPRGDKAAVMKYLIPVPPLSVQKEVIDVLDRFTELEAVLQGELEKRQAQYAYYQCLLLKNRGDEVAWMTLGQIGKVLMCRRVFKEETKAEGDIPFYKIGTFGSAPDAFITQRLYDEYRERYPFPNRGDVLISAAGTIGRAIPYDGKPAYFQDSNIVWIDNDESIVSNAYLRHWYRVVEWNTHGGTIQRLYNENLRRTKIAVPSNAEQARIVSILDRFDTLITDQENGLPAELAVRKKQFEYYRHRLLTFEKVAA